jgi:glycogen synthase
MDRADVLYKSEPEKIHDMQQAAIRRIHAHHTWKRVMGRYLDLYEKARRKAC